MWWKSMHTDARIPQNTGKRVQIDVTTLVCKHDGAAIECEAHTDCPSEAPASQPDPGEPRVRRPTLSARSLGFVEAPGVEHRSGDVAGECRSE